MQYSSYINDTSVICDKVKFTICFVAFGQFQLFVQLVKAWPSFMRGQCTERGATERPPRFRIQGRG